MLKVSVCIPIFNEEENIEPLFNEIVSSGLYGKVGEIIFIDDKSTDNSLAKIKKIKKNYNKVNIIEHNYNNGQSMCIYSGIKLSNYEVVSTIDGDGQNPPKDLLKLIDIYFSETSIYNNVKLVAGIRRKRIDSNLKKISSKLANKIRQLILKDNCPDTGCSIKVFDKKIFLQFEFFSGIHRFIPSLFEGKKYHVVYAGVEHKQRIYGSSKYGVFMRAIWGIRDLIKVKKMLIKND